MPGDPARMKDPVVEFCRWNKEAKWPEPIRYAERTYRPSIERPMVVHLFGVLTEPESLVITEDDFLDYLPGVKSIRDAVPPLLNSALVDSSLLRQDRRQAQAGQRGVDDQRGGHAQAGQHAGPSPAPDRLSQDHRRVRSRRAPEGWARRSLSAALRAEAAAGRRLRFAAARSQPLRSQPAPTPNLTKRSA